VLDCDDIDCDDINYDDHVHDDLNDNNLVHHRHYRLGHHVDYDDFVHHHHHRLAHHDLDNDHHEYDEYDGYDNDSNGNSNDAASCTGLDQGRSRVYLGYFGLSNTFAFGGSGLDLLLYGFPFEFPYLGGMTVSSSGGGGQGDNGDLAVGSANYVTLSRTGQVLPNTQDVAVPGSGTGIAESAIWNYDSVSTQLSMTWTNSDGSLVNIPTFMIISTIVCATPDQAAFQARYGDGLEVDLGDLLSLLPCLYKHSKNNQVDAGTNCIKLIQPLAASTVFGGA
ncbi:hypothetical protein OC835_007053, partial [Tilletia horrida]